MLDFYSQEKTSKNKGKYIYYYPYCKLCHRKKSRKWLDANPESKRRSALKNKKLHRERNIKNNKKYSDRDRSSGKYRQWQKDNSDKVKLYNLKRLHKKHDITKWEWESCKSYFNNECAYCGIIEKEHVKLFKQRLHKDHVSHNGNNDITNCVPACKGCNSSKRQYTLEDWYNSELNVNFSKIRLDKINKWLEEDCFDYREMTK